MLLMFQRPDSPTPVGDYSDHYASSLPRPSPIPPPPPPPFATSFPASPPPPPPPPMPIDSYDTVSVVMISTTLMFTNALLVN